MSHAYVWEFVVPAEARERFERDYGPQGPWARLFRRAEGYIETILLRDRGTPGRYLTVDRWESRDAYRRFRERFTQEYDEIDRQCEALTERETPLG